MMQEQNALIGIAIAGHFLDIPCPACCNLVGATRSSSTSPMRCGLGADGTQVLFNSGSTSAQVGAARAVYWQSVANYRQTVLTAFQQAENQLAPARILRQQLVMQQCGKRRAHCGRRLLEPVQDRLRWRSRLVVKAEITSLADEEAELTIRKNLFLASVSLIESLGGGRDTNLLPTQTELVKDSRCCRDTLKQRERRRIASSSQAATGRAPSRGRDFPIAGCSVAAVCVEATIK